MTNGRATPKLSSFHRCNLVWTNRVVGAARLLQYGVREGREASEDVIVPGSLYCNLQSRSHSAVGGTLMRGFDSSKRAKPRLVIVVRGENG